VALVAGAATPLIYNTMKLEENKDEVLPEERQRLWQHGKAVMMFLMLFIGMTLGMTFMYLILDTDPAVGLFSDQITQYKYINPAQTIAGSATYQKLDVLHIVTGSATTEAVSQGLFQRIFFNNLKVLFFCIVFSFIYGAGAIFVLSWNASVIALAIGNVIKTKAALAAAAGSLSLWGWVKIITVDGIGRYFLHGILEITSYVIAAIAGGIISVAIVKRHFAAEKTERIILDVSDLLLASFLVLLVSAVLEVYIIRAFA
jgi:uncharacterized membrane protein SpoIIM required for sporulation